MPKIELSITSAYQSKWGVWEGIREIVCNGIDADKETVGGAPLKVTWNNNVLSVENQGTTIPHEALLMGHSTKMDRSDTIGQFGEGFKIGILALVRDGYPVKVRNGSEVWDAALEQSAKFKAEVLVFNVQGGRKNENRVRVEIGEVTADTWEHIRERFRWLQEIDDDKTVTTGYGTLLLGGDQAGRIYVKGVFVRQISDLRYGYDLSSVTINRDRDILDSFDMNNATRKIWDGAVSQRPDLLKPLYKMLSEGAADIAGFEEWATSSMSDELKDNMAALFVEQFGANAVPVTNIGDSRDVEHQGKQGIVVPPKLKGLLSTRLDDADKIKESLKKEVIKSYGWSELSQNEKDILELAVDDLATVMDGVSLDRIEIVEFHDKSTLGLFDNLEGYSRFRLARQNLASLDLAMRVLVHEFAHEHNADHSKGFADAVETTWAKLYASLRQAKPITVN